MPMSMSTSHCAMCDGSMAGAPHDNMHVPPECLPLLENGDQYDPGDIMGDVTINFCENCSSTARGMVGRGETPLPKCDADRCSIQKEEVFEALLGGVDGDSMEGGKSTEEMVQDALMVVKMDQRGDTDHLLPSKIYESKAIVLSLKELGYIGDADE